MTNRSAAKWRRPPGERDRRARGVRIAAAILLVLYPVAAGTLLLTADGWAVNRANVRIWFAVTGALGVRDRVSPEQFAEVANVALFVPFFAALAVLVPTWWWILLGAGLSAAVELYQGTLGTREQDVRDVLANTSGAALGVVAGLLLRHVLLRRERSRVPPLGLSGAGTGPSAPTTPAAPRPESADDPDGGPDGRG